MIGGPPGSLLFPYTTLFRSTATGMGVGVAARTVGAACATVGAACATVVGATVGLTIVGLAAAARADRKSTRLNSSHTVTSYAVFCLKKKKKINSIAQSRTI